MENLYVEKERMPVNKSEGMKEVLKSPIYNHQRN